MGGSSSPSTSALGLAEQAWVIQPCRQRGRPANALIQEGVSKVERPRPDLTAWFDGAQQAYPGRPWPQSRWSGLLPCGHARNHATPPVPLKPAPALTADPAWDGTRFKGQAPRSKGLRTFACLASWGRQPGPSYRQGRHKPWATAALRRTWSAAGCPPTGRHDSPRSAGRCSTPGWPMILAAAVAEAGQQNPAPALKPSRFNLAAAWGGSRARTTVIAGSHDLYFPPARLRRRSRPELLAARFERLESGAGQSRRIRARRQAEQAVISRRCLRTC